MRVFFIWQFLRVFFPLHLVFVNVLSVAEKERKEKTLNLNIYDKHMCVTLVTCRGFLFFSTPKEAGGVFQPKLSITCVEFFSFQLLNRKSVELCYINYDFICFFLSPYIHLTFCVFVIIIVIRPSDISIWQFWYVCLHVH